MALRLPRLRLNRLWLTMIAAIVLGLLAAWLSVNYIKSREARMMAELAQKAKGGATVAVVVPVRDVPKGTVVSQKVVAARDVVPDLLYDDAVTADQFDKIAGKRLLKPLLKGRPLRMSDVIDDHAKDLSDSLVTGFRALTFDIDEVNSFAQMLRPGNFVDLYLIAQDPGAPPPSTQEIRALLPRVKVLATGQTIVGAAVAPDESTGQPGRPQASYSNITVEVTPSQAARIALAQQVGRIRVVLRNAEDDKATGFSKLAATALFRDGRMKPSIEYIVGGRASGSGATPPININMPNFSIPGLTAMPGAPTGSPAGTPAATATSYSPGQSAAFSGQPAAIGASIPAVPTGAR
jgi:pilus assembly protein CpaB